MSKSNTALPTTVAAEGMAFNAPGSDRVSSTADGQAAVDVSSQLSQEDELDFLEQLSRLNSDFEDGLDVVRELESQCKDDGYLSPTFANLVACAFHKAALGILHCARRHPVATSLGVTTVGTVFGIAIARRFSGRQQTVEN